MKKDLHQELTSLEDSFLYRRRNVTEGPATVVRSVQGKEVISFSSNDYLGLANDSRIVSALIKGAGEYGVGSGASHLVNGYSVAHRELEETLAEFTRRPRALFFTTGYMANIGVITALTDRSSIVFEDRLNHASLIDGGLLAHARMRRYPHNDVDFLNQNLNPEKHCVVVTDAVFSMDGDLALLSSLADVCTAKQATLMVDDAHGFGVFGKDGSGVCTLLNLDYTQVPILVGTLGKSAGVCGAFIAGDEDLIETLIQKARSYIYTTAPPPALACAAHASIQIIRTEHWRRTVLFERIAYFKQLMQQAGIECLNSASPIQGVLTGSAQEALQMSEHLMHAGIQVTAIRPPTVAPSGARLRITLSCAHEKEHIEKLVECLAHYIPQIRSRSANDTISSPTTK